MLRYSIFVLLLTLQLRLSAEAKPFRPTSVKIPLHAPDVSKVKFSNAFPRLKFDRPVFMTNVPGDNSRFFVVEQSGLIRVFPNLSTTATTQTFADLKSIVSFDGGEMGLLGMAFSPDYKQSGEFFVSYTLRNPNRFVVARIKVSANPNAADLATRSTVLEVTKPANFPNHNGGMIAFGPDRKLYIGIGDSGSAGDPFKNAQNKNTLWGKILRIDPLASKPYSIPVDNPLVGVSQVKEEIWAWGLRNPWRFSFDKKLGVLWAGDVGQDLREEINIIERGGNYGWNVFEAHLPFNNPENISFSQFKAPIWEYPHNPELSITGGYVYRGSKLPYLKEKYLYADYGSGRVWALQYKNKQVLSNDELGVLSQPSSFAEDEEGELYVLSLSEGVIYSLSQQDNPNTEQIPAKLSETGIFSNTITMTASEGVEEYPVIAPLWSDGALKKDGWVCHCWGPLSLRQKLHGIFL